MRLPVLKSLQRNCRINAAENGKILNTNTYISLNSFQRTFTIFFQLDLLILSKKVPSSFFSVTLRNKSNMSKIRTGDSSAPKNLNCLLPCTLKTEGSVFVEGCFFPLVDFFPIINGGIRLYDYVLKLYSKK